MRMVVAQRIADRRGWILARPSFEKLFREGLPRLPDWPRIGSKQCSDPGVPGWEDRRRQPMRVDAMTNAKTAAADIRRRATWNDQQGGDGGSAIRI